MNKQFEIEKIFDEYDDKRDEIRTQMMEKAMVYEGNDGDVPPDIAVWGIHEVNKLRTETVAKLMEIAQ